MSWWTFKRKLLHSTQGKDPEVSQTKRRRMELGGSDDSEIHPVRQTSASTTQDGRQSTSQVEPEPYHASSFKQDIASGFVSGRGQRNRLASTLQEAQASSTGQLDARPSSDKQTRTTRTQVDSLATVHASRKNTAFDLGQDCLATIRAATTGAATP